MPGVIPIKEKKFSQPFVVVGAIIEKDNKFLLVQEGRVEAGKWNQPAGWLDLKEGIIEGAKREIKEETGLDIKFIGLLGVYNLIKPIDKKYVKQGFVHAVKFIFAAKPLSNDIKFDPDELLNVKWFAIEEIKDLGDKLRDADIINEIDDYLAGKIYPLEIIKPFMDYTQK